MTARGGSNYNWWHVNCCDREEFAVLKHYSQNSATVRAHLSMMYADGQRRLRVMVYHAADGQGTGTVIEPSEPVEAWLTAFLRDIKTAGFEEIMVALSHADTSMINRVRAVVVDSGIHYRLDLANEGTVPLQHRDFANHKEVWKEYVAEHGKADTVGFSIPLDHRMKDRLDTLTGLYSDDMPYLFSVHSYGWATDEFLELTQLDHLLTSRGHSQGIIIGECFYNDPESAARIERARMSINRPIFYLCQWPWRRNAFCKNVDGAPPSYFEFYREKGF